MGVQCSCESKEAKLKKAQANKRADEALRIAYEVDVRKDEAAKRYREDNEKKKKSVELENHAQQLFHKVKTTQNEVTTMYDQIRSLQKDNKLEDATTLAKNVVAREEYLVELRIELSYLIKQANELEMAQLSVDLNKTMDGINQQLKTQVRDCKELTEMLIENKQLVSEIEQTRSTNQHLMTDNSKAYKVADVLKRAERGDY